MKVEDCKVGAIVYTHDGPLYRYKVMEPPNEEGMVKVASVGNTRRHRHDTMHVSDLFLYDEAELKRVAAALQERINAAQSAFERAFEELDLVKNFREQGITLWSLKESDFIDLDRLRETVDASGWTSSALWC